MIKGEGVPSYFKKGWRERKWSRIARVKVEKVRGSRYWEEKEEERMCKLCGGARESWEHMWEECRDWKRKGESW